MIRYGDNGRLVDDKRQNSLQAYLSSSSFVRRFGASEIQHHAMGDYSGGKIRILQVQPRWLCSNSIRPRLSWQLFGLVSGCITTWGGGKWNSEVQVCGTGSLYHRGTARNIFLATQWSVTHRYVAGTNAKSVWLHANPGREITRATNSIVAGCLALDNRVRVCKRSLGDSNYQQTGLKILLKTSQFNYPEDKQQFLEKV